MPNRKYNQKNIRKVFKKGGSFAISIPIELFKSLGWNKKQKLKVKKIKGGFQVRDWKK